MSDSAGMGEADSIRHLGKNGPLLGFTQWILGGVLVEVAHEGLHRNSSHIAGRKHALPGENG